MSERTSMTASRPPAGNAITLAACLAVLTVGTWWWQNAVFRTKPIEVKGESWGHVKEAYPIPGAAPESPILSPGMVEAVVHANPFSPERRLNPPSSTGGAEAGGASGESGEAPRPKFLYKGQVKLGKRPRAIVEEAATHKTYFLEVGQEVSGFKVLDIAENRVVLSDPQTHEEVVVSLTSSAGP